MDRFQELAVSGWMPFDSPLLAFVLTSLVIEMTPGPHRGPVPSTRELALLVAIYVGVATLVHGLIVVLASSLQTFLAMPRRRIMAGNLFAVMLTVIAIWLFVSAGR